MEEPMGNFVENAPTPRLSPACKGLDAAAYVFSAIYLLASVASAVIGASCMGFADSLMATAVDAAEYPDYLAGWASLAKGLAAFGSIPLFIIGLSLCFAGAVFFVVNMAAIFARKRHKDKGAFALALPTPACFVLAALEILPDGMAILVCGAANIAVVIGAYTVKKDRVRIV